MVILNTTTNTQSKWCRIRQVALDKYRRPIYAVPGEVMETTIINIINQKQEHITTQQTMNNTNTLTTLTNNKTHNL